MNLVNNEIILFGGYGPGGRLNDVWKLDPGNIGKSYLLNGSSDIELEGG